MTTEGTDPTPSVGLAAGRGVWVVVPTYDERENLPALVEAVMAVLPEARLLVVDDHSPDGTGDLADSLAAANPRVEVLHRPAKQGLGAAYRDGFKRVLDQPGTMAVVQMDADFS
ncbi:MAG: glycosyltransferase, partial [Chloroflexi bacterium]